MRRGGVRHRDQKGVGGVVHIDEPVPQSQRRVQQLAVHVELSLVPGPVSDPNRGAVPPAREVRERPLRQVVLAAGDSGVLLHEAIGHGLEADFNRKKTSNYSGRLGQSVAASTV